MRNLVVIEYLSLDGVAQAPGHLGEDPEGGFNHGGWAGPHFNDHRRYGVPVYESAGAFLFGRLTYQLWLEHWPKVTDPDDRIAGPLNDRPKYVVSTTLTEATWPGTTVIRDRVTETVAGLKQEHGGDIVVPGSTALAHTLMAHHLVDRYHLWLHPVVLGGGKRLFATGTPRADLRLIDVVVTGTGLAILTYEP